jgi:hypothetical protein
MFVSSNQAESADEREQKLWHASGRYLLGEITMKDLEKLEEQRNLRIRKAIFAFAKQRDRQRLVESVTKYFRTRAAVWLVGLFSFR